VDRFEGNLSSQFAVQELSTKTVADLRRNTMRAAKLLAVLCLCALCGCSVGRQFAASPSDKEISNAYRETTLKESTSADVLELIAKPEEGLISQSKSVIVSQGTNKKGCKLWFDMVAFDENALTAKRKSFFVVDEKKESVLLWPRRKLVFNAEMVLEPKVLSEPYANDNAKQIAILKQVAEEMREDVAEVAPDNKKIAICGGLVNQALGTVLQRLEESPVLASKLSDPNGFEFDHLTLGKGRIVMSVTDDIADVKVRVGGFVWSGEDPFALEE
jgi:hypothetical protein